jgi:hypothetical protein
MAVGLLPVVGEELRQLAQIVRQLQVAAPGADDGQHSHLRRIMLPEIPHGLDHLLLFSFLLGAG